jgi:hypothetical protein
MILGMLEPQLWLCAHKGLTKNLYFHWFYFYFPEINMDNLKTYGGEGFSRQTGTLF